LGARKERSRPVFGINRLPADDALDSTHAAHRNPNEDTDTSSTTENVLPSGNSHYSNRWLF